MSTTQATTPGVAVGASDDLYTGRVARVLELLIVPAVFFVVLGSFHLHFMLTAGDWDFWVDWKDREIWPLVTPLMAVTYCAALHYILWAHFRLPFGATFAVLTLLVGEWAVRYGGFHWWAHFPLNMLTPATFFAGAIIMDTILLLTRSMVLTAIFGAGAFGMLFYPTNWAWLAAYHVPVEKNGVVMTVADLIGFEYIRTSTPEYIRMIERGTLRTFGQHSAPVSAAFAGFASVLMYWLWWYIGKLFSTVKYIKGRV